MIPIGFGHRKRVGKDTSAKFLVNHLRMADLKINVQKAGFASKLKAMAHDLYKWAGLQSEEFYEDPTNEHLRQVKLPVLNKTPVEIWIGMGNGLRERIYDKTWYDYLFISSTADILVIKDMRFPIEADGILAAGGEVYRLDRDCVRKDSDGADDQLLTYDKWTGIIDNNGHLRELHEKIVAIADRLIDKLRRK